MSDKVQEFLQEAADGPVSLTIRDLLNIWDARARNYDIVSRIEHDLSAAGLRCEPGLRDGDSSSFVEIGVIPDDSGAIADPDGPALAQSADSGTEEEEDDRVRFPPAALLISDVPSARCDLARIGPDQHLKDAQFLMGMHGYSQVAVMSSEHDLHGAVSWQSIARARAAKSEVTLEDATFRAKVVYADDELLAQIDTIFQHDFVFVQDEDGSICGIVTAADLGVQFRDLTTPFFRIGEIEKRLRRCIDRAFDKDALQAATGSNKIESASDMMFGQYVKLLRSFDRWQQMGWDEQFPHESFVNLIDDVRKVRNKVMHISEDLTSAEKETLDRLLNCLKIVDPEL